MKALILAGGKGSRLRPITYSIAKQLVPVANKPVIEFGIDAIREAGIRDFGIIVGDSEKEIRTALGDGQRWDAQFNFIRQDEPLGLAHAVKTARYFLEDSPFIMYLGDNLIKGGVHSLVDEFIKDPCDALILLTKVSNPNEFGVAELQGNRVVRLEEKPAHPRSDLALVGVYLFSSIIHQAIETLKPSFRGEYEITDAIQTLIDWNKDIRSQIVTGWWKDTGTVESMLEANQLILTSLPHKMLGITVDSNIEDSVTVLEGAKIIRSDIKGPSIIGENCIIEDSSIGPYTSIAKESVIRKSRIEDSIVMDSCELSNITSPIFRSLIGRKVTVVSSQQDRMSLVLGDNSSVMLP